MSFLWYDTYFIQAYWRLKRQTSNSHEYDLNDTEWHNLYLLNRLFSQNPWGVIIDRTENIPHPFNMVNRRRYQWRQESRGFDEICLATAKKISESTNRPLAVKWSGGIDSTVALVALLQTVDWDRIVVVCTKDGHDEYPGLWKDIIEPNLTVMDPAVWIEEAPQYFTITGDAGDTTWAVIDDSFFAHSQIFPTSWKDWVNRSLFPELDFVEKFNSWSGREIKTVLELRTWFYLCCKWQDKAMRLYYDRPDITDRDGSPFFDFDDSFDVWTMNNLDKIIGDTWQSYKMVAKEFIYRFHPDEDYLKNKTKGYSQGLQKEYHWIIKNNRAKFAIDKNYKSHVLPSWPFMDMHQFEDWNDQYQLIPMRYLI